MPDESHPTAAEVLQELKHLKPMVDKEKLYITLGCGEPMRGVCMKLKTDLPFDMVGNLDDDDFKELESKALAIIRRRILDELEHAPVLSLLLSALYTLRDDEDSIEGESKTPNLFELNEKDLPINLEQLREEAEKIHSRKSK